MSCINVELSNSMRLNENVKDKRDQKCSRMPVTISQLEFCDFPVVNFVIKLFIFCPLVAVASGDNCPFVWEILEELNFKCVKMKLLLVIFAVLFHSDFTEGKSIRDVRQVVDLAVDAESEWKPASTENDMREASRSALTPNKGNSEKPVSTSHKQTLQLNNINVTFISTPSAEAKTALNLLALLYVLAHASQANTGFVNYYKPMVVQPNSQFVNYFKPREIEPNSQFVNYFKSMEIEPNTQFVNYFKPMEIERNTQFVNYFKRPMIYPSPLTFPLPLDSQYK